MHEPKPISLSVTRLAEPLAPPDRSAFLAALAQLLQHEPQPLGESSSWRPATTAAAPSLRSVRRLRGPGRRGRHDRQRPAVEAASRRGDPGLINA